MDYLVLQYLVGTYISLGLQSDCSVTKLPVLYPDLVFYLIKVREKDCVQTWVMATREKGIFIL